MWWILVCAALVHGRPDEDERLGFSEALASASASAGGSGWPGLGLPNPNPVPIDGVGCVQPGDMYNALLNNECYVCACFYNEHGYLKAKCAPCNHCWDRKIPLPIPVPDVIPLPPAPEPEPLPDISMPEPISVPEPIPIPETIEPIPVPEPIPEPAPICSPPTVIPGPPRPYPVPVPVPGKKVFVPVPVPSPPEKIYVPGPPVPVPVEVIKRVPVPYPVDKSYPVPSRPQVIRVPEPIPVPGVVRDLPSPPEQLPVPYPVDHYVPVSGKDRVMVVPKTRTKYYSVSKIIYVAEHCRYQEPLAPFRVPSDPCRIHICKVRYNFVYDEVQPGSSCPAYPWTEVAPYGYKIGGGSTYAQADASAAVSGASADASSQASTNSGSGYYGWGGSENQAHADATASSSGWGGDASAQADSQANDDYGLGEWGQPSALADALSHAGLRGYDLGGWRNSQASAHADALAQGLVGYGGLGGWGVSRADALANTGLEGYSKIAQADTSVNSGMWGSKAQADALANAASGGYDQADALAHANAVSDKSNHHVRRRSVSFSDYDETEKRGLAPLISRNPNAALIGSFWNRFPVWKNSDVWAQALAQAEANRGLGYSKAQADANSHAGLGAWENRELPGRYNGLGLNYHPILNVNSEASAHAESQASALEGYSNAQAEALVQSGLGLGGWGNLGPTLPGRYNGLGLNYRPILNGKNSDSWAQALAQAEANRGLGYIKAQLDANSHAGLGAWENRELPGRYNGLGLNYRPILNVNSEASAHAESQASALEGYSNAQAEALAQSGLGLGGWGNLGPTLPGRYNGLGLNYHPILNGNSEASAHAESQASGLEGYSNAQAEALAHAGLGGWGNLGPTLPGKYNGLEHNHLLYPIGNNKASAHAEAIARADELEYDVEQSDKESSEASEKCNCGLNGKCGSCGSGNCGNCR